MLILLEENWFWSLLGLQGLKPAAVAYLPFVQTDAMLTVGAITGKSNAPIRCWIANFFFFLSRISFLSVQKHLSVLKVASID